MSTTVADAVAVVSCAARAQPKESPMLVSLALIIVGFALLIGGANVLVDGASDLAARLGLPERVIGLTVVAIGTSLPELVVSIASAVEGHADMALGNVVGSCMANLLLILGLTAVITPVGLSRRTQRFEIPVSVLAALALLLFANLDGNLDALEGVVMLVAFALFLGRTAIVGLREGESGHDDADPVETPEDAEARSLAGNPVVDVALIAVGVALLKFGADFVVENSVSIASGLGVSERLVGITVVALGTCLPELVTSVVAAGKGNTDIAVGNVVGSNISNLLLVMGVPALFAPVAYDLAYNVDLLMLAASSLLLVGFCYVGERHVMTRWQGLTFVMLYVVYIVVSALR